MRLLNKRRYRLLKGVSFLAVTGLLAGCGAVGGFGGSGNAGLASAASLPANGPQADYPVLVGDAYQVAGQTFTPSDTLNYDEVGYLAAEQAGMGITGAHHTLPVPSYIEVTSLTTGRTILVRIERRGPMNSAHLLALSPAAMAQLQADAQSPVRVRRVNPPETERVLLRGGNSAPQRMDTPMSLVNVLKRQLPSALPVAAAPPVELAMDNAFGDLAQPQVEPAPIEQIAIEPSVPASQGLEPWIDTTPEQVAQAPLPAPAAAPRPRPQPQADGGFMVQAAAFSTAERADSAASALGGLVSQSGRFFRVQTGPFLSRSEAEASLAKVKAAGYSDARILTSG